MAARTYTARWVLPVAGPPLERGTVTVEGERIVAVEPAGVRSWDVDFGDAAMLPGLVNAHVHLDLTGMRGRCPPDPTEPFPNWLRRVIAFRRSQTPEKVQADIRDGYAECLRTGTTLLGDIAAGGASWDVLAAGPGRGIVFFELIGLSESRAIPAWLAFLDWKTTHQPIRLIRPGISPHAPYSVHLAFIGAAVSQGLRLAIHLAESAEEMELLESQTGPFVPFLQEVVGAWKPAALAQGLDVVLVHLVPSDDPQLLIHGNYLPSDVSLWHNKTIVYCPRTHAAFGHPPHPYREFLARGVRVALGTDGLSSNPDLDLLAEVRFVHRRHPDVSGETLLRMATLSGAEALGWAEDCGSLEPGKSADLVVVPMADSHDPYRGWLETESPCREVWIRGRRYDPSRAQSAAE